MSVFIFSINTVYVFYKLLCRYYGKAFNRISDDLNLKIRSQIAEADRRGVNARFPFDIGALLAFKIEM